MLLNKGLQPCAFFISLHIPILALNQRQDNWSRSNTWTYKT